MDEASGDPRVSEAAAFLLAAREHGPGPGFPDALRPRTEAEAYAIQRLVLARIGPIGGWKVGAPGPDGPITCAPMPEAGLHESPAELNGRQFTTREIESEIAFVLSHDLPPRDEGYEREEVLAAIGTCHPGLEVLQSRFADPDGTDALSNLADLIRHGAYVLGPAIEGWRKLDFAQLRVRQDVAGSVLNRVGNPAGDMIRLVQWLADEGAVWAGGLQAGQIVTCGSWTGKDRAPVGAEVSAVFGAGAGVSLRFG